MTEEEEAAKLWRETGQAVEKEVRDLWFLSPEGGQAIFLDAATALARLYRVGSTWEEKYRRLCVIEHLVGIGCADLAQKFISHKVLNQSQAPDFTEATYPDKQRLVAEVNGALRKFGCAYKHPESGQPCILLAISDDYGGKYVLSNRITKKRSHTTREIADMVHFDTVRDDARWRA